MIRGCFESLVIQYFGWDAKHLGAARREYIEIVDRYHGRGLGAELWSQVEEDIAALFPASTIDLLVLRKYTTQRVMLSSKWMTQKGSVISWGITAVN